MGLDIYLYTAAQATQNAAYDKATEDLYAEGPDGKSPRDKMTDEEFKAWAQRSYYSAQVDVPSEEYPDHLCNRRYLRSSYNGGGFNRAVPDFLGTGTKSDDEDWGSLYWIFEPLGRDWREGADGGLTTTDLPLLEQCHDRALEVEANLRDCDPLRVTTVSPNLFSAPPQTTGDEALATYRKVREDRGGIIGEDDRWSSLNLEVFGTGLSVLAAIPGRGAFGEPSVHLIYRAGRESLEHYAQTAKIAAEFCAEAIGLIRTDGSCEISWSG